MSKYMGQIMAECDCQHQACEMRGYCMAARIEQLELAVRYEADLAQQALDAREELEAKLTNQTHMIAQVFALLDVTEETEDGRVFHPTQIRSCRVLDAEKLGALLAELRDTLTANNKENSYAE